MPETSRVPLSHHAAYRLWRCKRLLVLVPVMIMLAGFLAGQLGGLSSYYFHIEEVLQAGAIALACTAIAVILLPNAPLEVLFGGLAAALLVATEPWQGLLFQPAEKGGDFTPIWLRCVIFGGAWIVLLSIFYAVAAAIANRKRGPKRPMKYALFVPGGDAAQLRRFLGLNPNSTSGPVTYGIKGWDGMVPACIHLRAHHPENFTMSDIDMSFTVKAAQSTPDMDIFLVHDDTQERETRYSYRDTPRGAWVMVEEHPGPPAALSGLSLRLNEGGADLLRARIDDHLGRPSPAFILCAMRSFLCSLAALTHVPGPKPRQPAE